MLIVLPITQPDLGSKVCWGTLWVCELILMWNIEDS